MVSGFPSNFISGAITVGHIVIAVLFLKFWRRTRDPLFGIFAGAFCLLAANQAAFSLSGSSGREAGWTYLLRLAAFALIILGIVFKNLGDERK